ncbi:hypothetical protein [Burkholderia gladioli]|uniref:hypothetical protein n=1 Tax=Burkholderia gladioli TaxID=28095 RepID=UPI001CC3524A|nr:hypothetical protein [Burkholderia gladioli]
MKTIQTQYQGYRFRSRLEARWAIFFDALCIQWEYEPEEFELASGARIAPTFWLPFRSGSGYWVDTPPVYVDHAARKDALKELATESGHHAYLIDGSPAKNVPTYRLPYQLVRGSSLSSLFNFVTLFTAPDKLDKALVASRAVHFEFGESGAGE